ncbi:hypothetical protein MRX96_046572 [Rhipicephalus microplus]
MTWWAPEVAQEHHESDGDACATTGSENVNAVQSTATVAELFVKEPYDLRGGKNDIGECPTHEQEVHVVGVAADAMWGCCMTRRRCRFRCSSQ